MTLPAQQQRPPGLEQDLEPKADHGEHSYRGSGRLTGKIAVITGADSGIGKAVAIAFAREGADIAFAYLNEHDDAADTRHWVEDAGRRCIAMPGDLAVAAQCRAVIDKTVEEFGGIDILVSNAAMQRSYPQVEDISDEEWDRTIAVNLSAFFHLVKAALPHMKEGASIIGTSSVNSDAPRPELLPYSATKAAIANMTASLAGLLGPRGIRANSVAPGPIWTPLIPSTLPVEHVEKFGADTPLGRPGQPADLAPVYVMLASDEGSYVSGARVAVTGGRPIL